MLFQMYEEDIICAFIDPSLFKDFEILMKSKFKINVMRKIIFFWDYTFGKTRKESL